MIFDICIKLTLSPIHFPKAYRKTGTQYLSGTLAGPHKNRKTGILAGPHKIWKTGTLAGTYKNRKTGTLLLLS